MFSENVDDRNVDFEVLGRLNNLGVVMLAAGDFVQAFECLKAALKYTMGELDLLEAARIHHMATKAQPEVLNGENFSVTSLNNDRLENRNKANNFSPIETTFVHSSGITISPSPTGCFSDALARRTIASGIIIFNMALAQHLKALAHRGSPSINILEKARVQYQKCRTFLVDAGISVVSSSHTNSSLDILLMALYNNLAQSSYEMALYEDSKSYFEILTQFAFTVDPSSYANPYEASLIEQQRSIFLLNALVSESPKAAPAA